MCGEEFFDVNLLTFKRKTRHIPRLMCSKRTTFGVLVIIAILFLLRLPAFWTPILDVDEAQFAGFADWLLHGGLPYVSSLDTKPLGIYWFFAAIFAVFGRNNMIAVHLVTALWVGVTALFCYFSARNVYSKRAGFLAALFYVVFSTVYIPKFISTSIVVIMMLPLTASIYAAIVWDRSEKMRWICLSGVFWGIASLFKYQAGINLVVMAVYLLVLRPFFYDRKIKWIEFAIFCLGGSFVGAAFAGYLFYVGVWDEFVRWSLSGSGAYIGAASMLTDFWHNLILRGGTFIASSLLIWVLTSIAAVRIVRGLLKLSPRGESSEVLLLLWFLLSMVAVSAGGKFYGHYFIQLLPGMCILAGGVGSGFSKKFLPLLVACILIPATGFFIARLYAGKIYAAVGEEDPSVYESIAEYISLNTKDDDKIFVWGFATPIYTFSNRLGASRFLWCDWLTGRVSGTQSAKDPDFRTDSFIAADSWGLFFEDMRVNKPVYFIDTSPGNHHDYGKYPINKFPNLLNYVNENYVFERTIAGADIYRRRMP